MYTSIYAHTIISTKHGYTCVLVGSTCSKRAGKGERVWDPDPKGGL